MFSMEIFKQTTEFQVQQIDVMMEGGTTESEDGEKKEEEEEEEPAPLASMESAGTGYPSLVPEESAGTTAADGGGEE